MSKSTKKSNLIRDIRRLRAIADELDGIIALTGMPAVLREIATNFSERFDVEEVAFAQARREAEHRNRIAQETKDITPSNRRVISALAAQVDIDISDLI